MDIPQGPVEMEEIEFDQLQAPSPLDQQIIAHID